MKRILALFFAFSCILANAQLTTTTATITDPDGTNWTGARVYVSFQPNPNIPNLNSYTIGGVPITSTTGPNYNQYIQQAITTNSSGAFTLTLLDNNLIQPSGSGWYFVVQSNTSAPAVTYTPVQVNGASINLTAFFTAHTTAPRFPAINNAFGYIDGEVYPIPQPGGNYFNSSPGTLAVRIWNGSAWQNPTGGIGYPSGSGFAIVSGGTAWGTTLASPLPVANGGTGATTVAANSVFGNFTGSTAAPGFSNAPIFSAASLTNFPTLNQNTTGTAAGLSSTLVLGSGGTGQTNGQDLTIWGTDSGSATAYVVTTTPTLTSLTSGLVCYIPANNNTTTNPTLNVDSLGVKTITQIGNNALTGTAIQTTSPACVSYNGTNYVLQNSAQPNSYFVHGASFPVPSTGCVYNATSTTAVQCTGTFPAGTLVGTSDTQTLTNKSIAASEINSGTLATSVGGTGVTSQATCLSAAAGTLVVPCLAYQASATALSATFAGTVHTLYTTSAPAAGSFEFCPGLFQNTGTGSPAGQAQMQVTWTTPGGTTETAAAVQNITFATGGGVGNGSCTMISTGANTTLSVNVTTSGGSGTVTWEYDLVVRRWN